MTPVEALHNAVRSLCVDRLAQWGRAYRAVEPKTAQRPDGSTDLTAEAWQIHPRFTVLRDLLVAVEQFVPADFLTVEDARDVLGLCAATYTPEAAAAPGSAAIADELAVFAKSARESTDSDWRTARVLPYRRVLLERETKRVRETFWARWGDWYGGAANGETPVHETLDVTVIDAFPNGPDSIRDILLRHDIDLCFELREFGASFELAVGEADFSYNGAEGFWFESSMRWMIYASHESTITFGGEWLLEELQANVEDWRGYRLETAR